MTTDEMVQLEEKIRGLWPTFFRSLDGKGKGRDPATWSAAMLDKLAPYSLREVCNGLQECLTNGKGMLIEADLLKHIQGRRSKRRYDPAAWMPTDEYDVQFAIARHRERLTNGYYLRRIDDGQMADIPEERQIEADAIKGSGKNPTEQERYEVLRELNRRIDEENGRLKDRGSQLRLTRYPEPQPPLMRQNGDNNG